MSNEISRKSFLRGAAAGAVGVGVAASGVLRPIEAAAGSAEAKAAAARVTKELPIPDTYEADRPKQTDYSVDVLVVGGGYAGMNAAYTARKAGKSVLLLDKGRPGYSGQSPWPGTFNYFDPEMGDSEQVYREFCRYGAEYFGNLDWIDVWMKESKAMCERIKSWGVLEMYPQMAETKYFATRDYYGYRDNVVKDKERRPKFVEVLDKNGIPPAELDLLVAHQANIRIIDAAQHRLGLPDSKVIKNIHKYGNTTAATIPLALASALEEGRLKRGDLVLMVSVGAGFTVGAVLARWSGV